MEYQTKEMKAGVSDLSPQPPPINFTFLEKSRIHFEKRKQWHVAIEDSFIRYPTSIFIA